MFRVAGSFDKRSHTKHVSTRTYIGTSSNVIVIVILHFQRIFASFNIFYGLFFCLNVILIPR